MTLRHKVLPLSMSAVFTLAAFVFLGFFYTYHLHYQEQLQLFQFTTAYFNEVVSVPGGFADYLGRFIIQFCYYARTGAFLIALLLLAVQLLTYKCIIACPAAQPLMYTANLPLKCPAAQPLKCSGNNSLAAYALSFLPAICLFIFMLDENAILGAAVSVALSLAGALGVTSIRKKAVKVPVLLVGIPVMYMLCGPLAIIYVTVALKSEKWQVWIPAVIVAVACPIISQYIFAYPLERLIRGIHYYRYPQITPLMPLLSAGLAILVSLAGCVKFPCKQKKDKAIGMSVYSALLVLTCILTPLFSDQRKETLLKYDFMLRYSMWNRIIREADRCEPNSPMSVSCLNIALAKTGKMERMFSYYQNGPQGLLPSFSKDCTTPVPTAEIYWQLGMVNTAQRFFFEAQESIPDYQKSARLYMRLAQTNIVNEDYAVAGKYLQTLDNTLFYSKWSKNTRKILNDPEAVNDFPEYVHIRGLRYHTHDFLYSENEMDSMLGLLYMENRGNSIAYDYLLAWTLLGKDLKRFDQCFWMQSYVFAPKHYQEAFLLNWVATHTDFNSLPLFIDRKNASRLSEFMKAYNDKLSESYMKSNFGDTYWFYYYYRYN